MLKFTYAPKILQGIMLLIVCCSLSSCSFNRRINSCPTLEKNSDIDGKNAQEILNTMGHPSFTSKSNWYYCDILIKDSFAGSSIKNSVVYKLPNPSQKKENLNTRTTLSKMNNTTGKQIRIHNKITKDSELNAKTNNSYISSFLKVKRLKKEKSKKTE
ncbi:hypothetical protein [Candidatus Sneabacter namystus]|uniref:Uncharacterized protein n=1 Tax=Candidatus Sneabacter namystus TaxID=2601646 RepID=A0A5C0UHA7_9RICK|nr:hypothetical protein [Candidatus Sneabacter namystus]QEK39525.1 hypothetical protein FZC37_01045 [Candidatus Sneabacter namystus]